MSIFFNGSTHLSNKPECQQKGLNWSISFIPGPFIGYQHPGDLLVRVLSWSSSSERGAGELSAGNTRICSRANKNNSRKGEDTGWGRGWGQPGQSLVSWTALPVRSSHDLVMGGISHNGSRDRAFLFSSNLSLCMGFPGGSAGEESACNEGDLSLIPELGISPDGGHHNPLLYTCLENPHGHRSLVDYSSWGRRVRHDWATKPSTAHHCL